MDIVAGIRRARRDARAFGPAFIGWRFARRDRAGAVRARTRSGDLYFRPDETDLTVLRQVFVDGEYDFSRRPQMARVRRRYDEILAEGKNPVIVDAGANIGAASIWFAEQFGRAKIAAVEPDPENAELARRNTASLPNVQVFEAAIGARRGGVTLVKCPGHAWAVRTERCETGLPVLTVPDLVQAFDQGCLFIVKVDIEGFEADLFSENIDWLDQAAAVIVEPHDWMLPGAGTSQSLQKALIGKGREILIEGENLIFV
jgi:FkbM family methyltransferase